jgi:RNA polymerase sigma-70 factor, ECF subfamily
VKPVSVPATDVEAAMIRQAQAGDQQAFSRLVEIYWDRLYRWLYHLAHDAHIAEDLTQDTLMKAYAGLKSFQAGTNFSAWLYRIAHNAFINDRRKKRRPEVHLAIDLAESQPGPLEKSLSDEALARLTRAMASLSGDFRAALLLRVEEGLSFREIASIVGTTEETARWRVFKARQKLLDEIDPESILPGNDE